MAIDLSVRTPTIRRAPETGGRRAFTALGLSTSDVRVLGLWLVICAYLLVQGWGAAGAGFGDSDDATRMVLVRELVSGRGWYDQKVLRIQAPDGAWLHWSRLLDGALAAPLWGLERLLRPGLAEFWLRLLWPLILILPLLVAARSLVRQFNPDPAQRPAAETAAGAMAVACLPLYAQFHPGRIDHHNVQILLWLIAFAGAAAQGRRRAAMAGGAIGLGLAIGLEAIVFEAAIAAFMAVRMLVQPDEAPRVRAFALALAATLTAAFLAQTPPWRWSVSACDALGLNLTLGIGVGCALLVAASWASGAALRLVLTVTAGAAAAAACLALDRACVHGPYAEIDHRIFPIWLNGIQEILSIPELLHSDFATGLTLLLALVYGLAAWLALGVKADDRRRPVYLLTGLMLMIAAASTWSMLRMSSYLMLAAIPASATLAARLAGKFTANASAPAVRLCLCGLILAPNLPAALVVAGMKLHGAPAVAATATAPDAGGCFKREAYQQLAALPPGLTVGETDLGAFVLAYTRSSVLAAPYHRADKGIMAAHAILAAPSARAEALASAARAAYVLTCRAHRASDDKTYGPLSLRRALEAGQTPTWLTRLSPTSSAIQIFGVRP